MIDIVGSALRTAQRTEDGTSDQLSAMAARWPGNALVANQLHVTDPPTSVAVTLGGRRIAAGTSEGDLLTPYDWAVYAGAMTKIGLVAGMSALTLASACARADAGPTGVAVPAGCEPTADRVTWSAARTTPMLIDAARYGADDLAAGASGSALLKQPFTPSITGVTAPDSWLTTLGSSLERHTGQPVHTTAPSAEGQSFGVFGSESGQVVIYTGITRVSADFAVQCDPTVHGALNAWAKTVAGAVTCQDSGDAELDVFGRQALTLCPRRPASASTPVDVKQFPTDQPAK
jgi:hypothetical protein